MYLSVSIKGLSKVLLVCGDLFLILHLKKTDRTKPSTQLRTQCILNMKNHKQTIHQENFNVQPKIQNLNGLYKTMCGSEEPIQKVQ